MHEVIVPPMVAVKVEQQVDSQTLWAEVFGAYPTYWGWTEVHFLAGSDWDKAGEAKVTIIDPEQSRRTVLGEKVLTVQDVAEAVSALGFDWAQLDAASSDAILQQAVLGEVVFG